MVMLLEVRLIPYWRNLSAVSLEDDLQLDKSNKRSYNKIIATLGYISQSNTIRLVHFPLTDHSIRRRWLHDI